MADGLRSILNDAVTLPRDSMPDDSKLVLWRNKATIIDYSDDDKDYYYVDDKDYSDLALAYYNMKHDTNYKVVSVDGGKQCFHTKFGFEFDTVHHGFHAAETTDANSAQSIKNFFAILIQSENSELVPVVSSCCIVDGLKTIGCKKCDILMCEPVDSSSIKEVKNPKSWFNAECSIESILSKYGHCLAPEVNLDAEARVRMRTAVLALEHFNKKKKKGYTLVDALPDFISIEDEFVIHCNFIAKQILPENDVSKKLFFAELQRKGFVEGGFANWVVTACLIIHGCETRHGCLICTGSKGKKVVHPTRGYLFGLYPRKYRSPRHTPPTQISLSLEDFLDAKALVRPKPF